MLFQELPRTHCTDLGTVYSKETTTSFGNQSSTQDFS